MADKSAASGTVAYSVEGITAVSTVFNSEIEKIQTYVTAINTAITGIKGDGWEGSSYTQFEERFNEVNESTFTPLSSDLAALNTKMANLKEAATTTDQSIQTAVGRIV